MRSAGDWEQRFDAVVRETERNLAKVKGTLQHTPTKYRTSPHKSPSAPERNILLELSTYQTSPKRVPQPSTTASYRTPTHLITNNTYTSCEENALPHKAVKFTSTPLDTGYHKELWKQEDEIQKLRKQISLLQQSNVHYEQEAKLLKSQVQSLKHRPRTGSPSVTRDVSRELDKFKSEVMDEMRRLKQDVGHGKTNGFTDKELSAIRKDVDSSRLRQAEDFQELKTDLENVRSRLVKVELEVTSVMADSKECIRKCQRLGSEASHFSETVRIQNRSTSSQLQSLNDNCAHLSILRDTVTGLEGRLSSLEGPVSRVSNFRNESTTPGSLRDSTATRGSSYMADLAFNKARQKPVKLKAKEMKNGLFDELDLSLDDLSVLSDDLDEEDEITLDKSLDVSQVSDNTSTFKNNNKKHNTSLTESVSVGEETLSLAGDLISGISGILSDEDIL